MQIFFLISGYSKRKRIILSRFFIPLVLIVLCIFASSAFAQKKEAIEASKFGYDLERLEKYAEALYQYNLAIAADPNYPYPVERIGAMYQKLHNYPKAVEFLRRAIALDPNFDDYNYYNVGYNYRMLHKLDSALIYYKIFSSRMKPLVAEDSAALRDAEFLELLTSQSIALQNEPKNTSEPIALTGDINSKYDDFAPVITIDGSILYYTSRRPSSNFKVFTETNDFGDDIFASKKDDKNNWGPSVALSAPVNSKDDEGAAAISPDGQTVYYSLCRRPDGYGDCDIYQSTLTGSDWSKPKNLGREFNSQQWDGQPSIAPNGIELYFCSKRPGSVDGSEDIWVSYRNTDGSWGQPINLGPTINTPYSERSPFIASDGITLYFSSNGHPGYGAHDLFMTRKQPDGTWKEPINLGRPINSEDDDEFLSIPAKGTIAYFSSRHGKSGLDIYQATLPKNVAPFPVTLVSGVVLNKYTKQPMGAKIELADLERNEPLGTYNSNTTNGEFYFPAAGGKKYGVTASATGFTFYSEHFEVPDSSSFREIKYKIELMPLDTTQIAVTAPSLDTPITSNSAPIALNNMFFDFNKATIRNESITELKQLIRFLNENSKVRIEISGHTDSVGTPAYNLKLSQDRANAVREYLISHSSIAASRIVAKGYGESKPIAPNDTEENKQKNRRTEFIVLGKKQ